MKVLYIEPLKPPRIKEIDGTLESMHRLVHGDLIEAIYPYDDPVALVCSETGKLDGSPPNRVVGSDIIHGPFFICGLGTEDFTGLSPDLIEKYSSLFAAPEVFIPTESGLAVIKVVAGPLGEV